MQTAKSIPIAVAAMFLVMSAAAYSMTPSQPAANGLWQKTDEQTGAPVAPVRGGQSTRGAIRPAIAGEIHDNIGELVHGSPPLGLSKAGRRAAARLKPYRLAYGIPARGR